MTTRLTTLAVLAAFGLASVPVSAATSHRSATHKGSTASADNSADQLNAQSLTAARSGTAFTPAGAPAAAPETKPMHGKKAAPSKS